MLNLSKFNKFFITGGAGFIGSTLADRLLALGKQVIVYDNFSTGFKEFIQDAGKHKNFKLVTGDLLDKELLNSSMGTCDFVFHLAANADVRFGTNHPFKDLEQNTIATSNVLEAMRHNNIKNIAFSSTGSVYGETATIPTPEDCPFPIQTSLYGASKLAAEGLISAYAEGFGFNGWIFRFVSVLGERYTHGHVFDFIRKLSQDPDNLEILGNGTQRKSYMYVQDCIDAMLLSIEQDPKKLNIINLGFDEYIEVKQSVGIITGHLKLNPTLHYTGGDRGWIGDNPFIFLDTNKIKALGWHPKQNIESSIIKTATWLLDNKWVFEKRS